MFVIFTSKEHYLNNFELNERKERNRIKTLHTHITYKKCQQFIHTRILICIHTY